MGPVYLENICFAYKLNSNASFIKPPPGPVEYRRRLVNRCLYYGYYFFFFFFKGRQVFQQMREEGSLRGGQMWREQKMTLSLVVTCNVPIYILNEIDSNIDT